MYREHAGDIKSHQGNVPSVNRGKTDAGGREANVLCDYIGVVALRRVGDHGALQAPGHELRPFVIQIDAGNAALGE